MPVVVGKVVIKLEVVVGGVVVVVAIVVVGAVDVVVPLGVVTEMVGLEAVVALKVVPETVGLDGVVPGVDAVVVPPVVVPVLPAPLSHQLQEVAQG